VQSDDRPIAVADGFHFLSFRYYGDSVLRRRIYYLSSEEFAYRHLGFTVAERGLMESALYFGTQVADYGQWVKQHPCFYVLAGPEWWLVPQLLKDGANLQLIQSGSDVFYRVTMVNSESGCASASAR
jgi:hypothetical protein